MKTERTTQWLRTLARSVLVGCPLLAFACGTTREDPTGGETHFFTCDTDADCSWLSPRYSCSAGYCSTEPTPSCPTPAVAASEVVVLGDSFFAASHLITGFLEERARQSGALAPGERYRDESSVIENTLALAMPGIEAQYATVSEESAVKVVIMTGGGADVLLGSCDSVSASCELLVAARDAASRLFERLAVDGVEHVVYVFYPDPADPGLRAKVDTLRPLLATACEGSPVPCHWVDLRETFAGKEATYLDATGTAPTAQGAEVAAQQIWDEMKASCVAQAP